MVIDEFKNRGLTDLSKIFKFNVGITDSIIYAKFDTFMIIRN